MRIAAYNDGKIVAITNPKITNIIQVVSADILNLPAHIEITMNAIITKIVVVPANI